MNDPIEPFMPEPVNYDIKKYYNNEPSQYYPIIPDMDIAPIVSPKDYNEDSSFAVFKGIGEKGFDSHFTFDKNDDDYHLTERWKEKDFELDFHYPIKKFFKKYNDDEE